MDILRRGLWWGGVAGLGVYLFAVLTDNQSLYTSAAPDTNDISLEHLSYAQLKHIYEDEVRKAVLRDGARISETISQLHTKEWSDK